MKFKVGDKVKLNKDGKEKCKRLRSCLKNKCPLYNGGTGKIIFIEKSYNSCYISIENLRQSNCSYIRSNEIDIVINNWIKL